VFLDVEDLADQRYSGSGGQRADAVQHDRQAVEALADGDRNGMNDDQDGHDQQEARERGDAVPVCRHEQRNSASQQHGAENQCQQHLPAQGRRLLVFRFEAADAIGGWLVEDASARPALQCVLKGPKHDATSVILRIAQIKGNFASGTQLAFARSSQ
jgi:hypothetical protein